jgi:NADPH-dependent curcumin reductase CurA
MGGKENDLLEGKFIVKPPEGGPSVLKLQFPSAMDANTNRQILFNKHPEGRPGGDSFRLEPGKIPKPQVGEILMRMCWLSVDPYMRGRMNPGASYIPPFELRIPIKGGVVIQPKDIGNK